MKKDRKIIDKVSQEFALRSGIVRGDTPRNSFFSVDVKRTQISWTYVLHNT